jgi:DNA-binding response OmpR family regulator
VDTIVVASDTASIRREVGSVLEGPETEVLSAGSGREVLELVAEYEVDLVIADLQMGSMGGVAVCLELRLQASYDALDAVPVLLLLDRRPDVFQARRSGAEGWLVKPLDALRIRAAARALLNDERYEDISYQPVPVLVPDTRA